MKSGRWKALLSKKTGFGVQVSVLREAIQQSNHFLKPGTFLFADLGTAQPGGALIN
jgi:hypothetical protein